MAFDHLDQASSPTSARPSPPPWPPAAGRRGPRGRQEAEALVRAARRGASRQGVVESFLQEFSLVHAARAWR